MALAKIQADFDTMPVLALMRGFQAAQRRVDENQAIIRMCRAALIKKTGHGPNKDNHGITCICGQGNHGGYPSDMQRDIGSHVLAEWEKAANG